MRRFSVARETPSILAAAGRLTRTGSDVRIPVPIDCRFGKDTCMPIKRRSKPSYAWALRLAEPKYARYIAERRLAVWRKGGKRAWIASNEYWPSVLRGLADAQELAEYAKRRRMRGLLEGRDPREWLDPVPGSGEHFGKRLGHLQQEAENARRALFDGISDRAIRHRLDRFAGRLARPARVCTLTGCHNELPRSARSTRKRCDACRAAGHRR